MTKQWRAIWEKEIPGYFIEDGKTIVADTVWEFEDAVLIEAAPQLLESLQTLVAEGNGCSVSPEDWAKAVAAIARATRKSLT